MFISQRDVGAIDGHLCQIDVSQLRTMGATRLSCSAEVDLCLTERDWDETCWIAHDAFPPVACLGSTATSFQ